MSFAPTHSQALGVAAAIVVLVAAGIFFWWRRRPRDPEEVERRRRTYVNRIGRIVEGQILEIVDRPAPQRKTASWRFLRSKTAARRPAVNGTRKLVCYSYAISGVTYETAQDVTDLEERACLDKVISGQAASVKYDPANPSNSILIAEDWSGLR